MIREVIRAAILAALLALAAPAAAQTAAPPERPLADPALERQAQGLMHTLRCVVCQQASIADSQAEMAGEMRALVRTRLAAGDRPEQVRSYLVGRYGPWIDFRPPVSAETYLLWGAPVLILGLGALAARPLFRRKAAQ